MTTDSTAATATVSPAALYLANLSEGSQGMRQPLDVVARILDEQHDAESYPWHELTYRDSMAVRSALIQRYKPSTVNKTLSAFRGVLKQAWRLGLMDADTYHRTYDLAVPHIPDPALICKGRSRKESTHGSCRRVSKAERGSRAAPRSRSPLLPTGAKAGR